MTSVCVYTVIYMKHLLRHGRKLANANTETGLYGEPVTEWGRSLSESTSNSAKGWLCDLRQSFLVLNHLPLFVMMSHKSVTVQKKKNHQNLNLTSTRFPSLRGHFLKVDVLSFFLPSFLLPFVIPALGSLRQKNLEFEASLCYRGRPCPPSPPYRTHPTKSLKKQKPNSHKVEQERCQFLKLFSKYKL